MSYQIRYPGKMPGESQALERTVVFLLVLTLTRTGTHSDLFGK